MQKNILQVEGVTKRFILKSETVHALRGVSFTVAKGETLCILGSSGSGKSTLLNILAGFLPPSEGSVHVMGCNLHALPGDAMAAFLQTHLGFVFQSYHLFHQMTVLENIAFPLLIQGESKKLREEKAMQLLDMVGLSDKRNHLPKHLSGGGQQRIAIARAFVNRPNLILADEPTGNLDTKTTLNVLDCMFDMASRFHQTMVIVSHDLEVTEYAGRKIVMQDGLIQQDIRIHKGEPLQ